MRSWRKTPAAALTATPAARPGRTASASCMRSPWWARSSSWRASTGAARATPAAVAAASASAPSAQRSRRRRAGAPALSEVEGCLLSRPLASHARPRRPGPFCRAGTPLPARPWPLFVGRCCHSERSEESRRQRFPVGQDLRVLPLPPSKRITPSRTRESQVGRVHLRPPAVALPSRNRSPRFLLSFGLGGGWRVWEDGGARGARPGYSPRRRCTLRKKAASKPETTNPPSNQGPRLDRALSA